MCIYKDSVIPIDKTRKCVCEKLCPNYMLLSHDFVSGRVKMPYIKINQPLVVYMFVNIM